MTKKTQQVNILNKALLTPDEAAEYLSVSKKTIYTYCKTGQLDSIIIGGRPIRIKTESILKIKNGEV